jgi:hypothetical protein
MRDEINGLLRQQVDERVTFDQVRRGLVDLAERCRSRMTGGAVAAAAPAAAAQPGARKSNVIKGTPARA